MNKKIMLCLLAISSAIITFDTAEKLSEAVTEIKESYKDYKKYKEVKVNEK